MLFYKNLIKRLKQERGAGYIGAIIIMVTLSAATFSLLNIHSTDIQIADDFQQTHKAMSVGNAGIVYARHKLNNGEDPVVSNKSFEDGQFTVQTTPNSGLVTVTSSVGNANNQQSLNVDFGENCVNITDNQLKIQSNSKIKIEVGKTCNLKTIYQTVNVTWNISPDALAITCGTMPCLATPQNLIDLGNASVVYGTAEIDRVVLNGKKIFQATGGVPTVPHDQDVPLDTSLSYLDSSSVTDFVIEFNTGFAAGSWFWFTWTYLDNSQMFYGPVKLD